MYVKVWLLLSVWPLLFGCGEIFMDSYPQPMREPFQPRAPASRQTVIHNKFHIRGQFRYHKSRKRCNCLKASVATCIAPTS